MSLKVKDIEVDGFEGLYKVREDGVVFSNHNYHKSNPKIRKVGRCKNGYKKVDFFNKGKQKTLMLHRLLAIAFIPNPENKPCVNHKDGDRTNNKLSNLEWCTYSENLQHAYGTGLKDKPFGEKNGFSKLTREQVIQIKQLLAEGKLLHREIACFYDISEQTISSIKNNRTWAEVN